MRKSIFSLLQNFHHFTSTPSLLSLPFALSTLLSHSFNTSSSLFPWLHTHLTSLSLSSGIPPQSQLFTILNIKLSQTILSSLFLFPFTISSLLLSKTSTIRALHPHSHPFMATFRCLLITHFCNSLITLAANATCLSLLIMLFNCLDASGLSSPRFLLLLSALGAVFYSIVLANACTVCSLSLVVSGVEGRGGFDSVLRAWFLIFRGGTTSATALSLVVVMNVALGGVEGVFEYRVAKAYRRGGMAAPNSYSMAFEALIVAYLYALLLVLQTVVDCVLLKNCSRDIEKSLESVA